MSEEKENQYSPVSEFFSGVGIGSLILLFIIFCSFLLFPLLGNIFTVMMALVIAIQFIFGTIAWIRWKRKFIALGLFFSLPIVAYIYYLICGSSFW